VIVANRARRYTKAFQSLMRFLKSLKIPVAAVLRDSQAYMRFAETGLGLHEMKGALLQEDVETWKPLIEWLERRSGALLRHGNDAVPEGQAAAEPATEPATASAGSALSSPLLAGRPVRNALGAMGEHGLFVRHAEGDLHGRPSASLCSRPVHVGGVLGPEHRRRA